MGKGLLIGGIVLGGVALFWSFLVLGIYLLLAATGGESLLLITTLVGFGAGALSIAGGIIGVKRAEMGAARILVGGIAGLLAAATPLQFNLDVEAIEFLIAYLAVGWWAILMALLGGLALFRARRAAGSLKDAAGPGP